MMEILSESFSSFGLKLLKEIVTDGQTVVLSPAAITLCSGVVYVGTKGQTKQELKGTLFPLMTNDEELLEGLKKIELALMKSNSFYLLNMANRVFCPSDYEIRDTYVEILRKYFKCDLAKVNLSNDVEQARQEINSWVKDNTSSKIRDCLSVGILAPKSSLIMVENVYFQYSWENCTTKQNVNFRPNDTTEIKVEMVQISGDNFKYKQNEQCQVLGIPVNESEMIIYYILPNQDVNLNKFVENLTGYALIKLLDSAYTGAVHAEIPLFNLQQRFNLTEHLKNIGVNDLFTGTGNFSELLTDGKAKVSAIVHVAYIENKVSSKSVPSERREFKKEPYNFVANRPFIFAVVEQTTMSFVLLGHYFG